jgi:hypothetical protein
MLATLCSYESRFGPYHPQTLCLTAQVAIAHWQAGEPGPARPLLERAVRDMDHCLGREHDLRLRAIVALRDLLAAQRDHERAASVQRELLECQIRKLGCDHPETVRTRAGLATMLLDNLIQNPAAS